MTTFAPPSTPPPLTPGNRTAIRVLLAIAAAVLVVTCVTTLGMAAFGIASLRVTTDGKDLPKGMRSLVIDASDAAIRVTTDPKAIAPRVELRSVRSSRGGQQRLEVMNDAAGTRIVVTPNHGHFLAFNRTGEVTVTLPPSVGPTLSVTTQQDDGTLRVDADLDRLTVNSTDGDVLLSGAVHVVDVTARDGDVIARKPLSVAESFVSRSVDGDVIVAFGDATPRSIEATTRDGDVAITLPPAGPYLVRTQSGDASTVDVPETTDPARAASEVTVRSEDGNVAVTARR
ncbi:DUF4097 family beta strand repeat-containing protein [Mycobacterium sp. NPDC006124]|uniref:DUF4097 family beta strand repeat-containing protein n=1 Tax=Mycobacterium sp. NPDC006124 TaxID=3156729 RepID=UPI0033B3CBC3